MPFLFVYPFRKGGGGAKWLLQDYRTSFNGRGEKKGAALTQIYI